MEKQNANEVTFTDTEKLQSILQSESSILSAMGQIFSSDSKESGQQGLVQMISSLDRHGIDIVKKSELIKTFLCALACKEFAVADILNAIACYKAVDKGLIQDESTCCEC